MDPARAAGRARRQGRKLLLSFPASMPWLLLCPVTSSKYRENQDNSTGRIKGFRPLRGASCFSLLVQREIAKSDAFNNRMAGQQGPGRDPSGCARRPPVLLARRGDSAQLASLRYVRLFAPRHTAMLGSLYVQEPGAESPATATTAATKPTHDHACGNGQASRTIDTRRVPRSSSPTMALPPPLRLASGTGPKGQSG